MLEVCGNVVLGVCWGGGVGPLGYGDIVVHVEGIVSWGRQVIGGVAIAVVLLVCLSSLLVFVDVV